VSRLIVAGKWTLTQKEERGGWKRALQCEPRPSDPWKSAILSLQAADEPAASVIAAAA
jgi:hypothetical protein